ncbi:MAG: cation transporter [Halofilum sp. (in: g-proteobacteria)]|nr:cation transporter [Halofilum sp. (in: g-proteobacteria)]
MHTERATLLLSSMTALLMGLVGVAFALVTNSRAIMLDGVFNAIYFAVGLATVRIERLAREPDNPIFPFGHAYFESLVNAGKGLVILGISVIALADSTMAIATGGRAIVASWAIGYALLAMAICGATALWLRRSAARFDSPLVDADAANWKLNAVVSAAVLAGFCLGPVFEAIGWRAAAHYIDPVLVAAVVILFLGVPIRLAHGSILELLNRAPPSTIEGPVTRAIDAVLDRLPVTERYVRMVRPGRTLYVLVHVVLGEGFRVQRLAELDALRAEIDAAVRQLHPRALVDVMFTADSRWAAPSAGLPPPGGTD